jgi:hypothetical protein
MEYLGAAIKKEHFGKRLLGKMFECNMLLGE